MGDVKRYISLNRAQFYDMIIKLRRVDIEHMTGKMVRESKKEAAEKHTFMREAVIWKK